MVYTKQNVLTEQYSTIIYIYTTTARTRFTLCFLPWSTVP